MSEFWIVSAGPHEEHPNMQDARRERDNLLRHVPDKAFRIYRCKRNIHPAKHFPKMVELLQDIQKDGLTAANRDRLHVILTIVRNRNDGMPITHREGLL